MLTFSEISDNFLKHLGYTPYTSSSEDQAKSLSSNLFDLTNILFTTLNQIQLWRKTL